MALREPRTERLRIGRNPAPAPPIRRRPHRRLSILGVVFANGHESWPARDHGPHPLQRRPVSGVDDVARGSALNRRSSKHTFCVYDALPALPIRRRPHRRIDVVRTLAYVARVLPTSGHETRLPERHASHDLAPSLRKSTILDTSPRHPVRRRPDGSVLAEALPIRADRDQPRLPGARPSATTSVRPPNAASSCATRDHSSPTAAAPPSPPRVTSTAATTAATTTKSATKAPTSTRLLPRACDPSSAPTAASTSSLTVA